MQRRISTWAIQYYSLHRYEEALDAYKNAVRINPRFEEALISLGIVSSMLGNDKELLKPWNPQSVSIPGMRNLTTVWAIYTVISEDIRMQLKHISVP